MRENLYLGGLFLWIGLLTERAFDRRWETRVAKVVAGLGLATILGTFHYWLLVNDPLAFGPLLMTDGLILHKLDEIDPHQWLWATGKVLLWVGGLFLVLIFAAFLFFYWPAD